MTTKKIDPRERERAVELARPHFVATWNDQHDALSSNERGELRRSLQRVQSTGSSEDELRARRLLAMLDSYEDAEHYQTLVDEALKASNYEGAESALTAVRTNINDELDGMKPENLDDILGDNPGATPDAIVELCKEFYAKKLDELRKLVADEFRDLESAARDTKAAFEKIDPAFS